MMEAFADLYTALDETTRTNRKVAALADYFRAAPPRDAAWALYFLSGRKPRQVVPRSKLRAWACAAAGLSDWLFDESYHAVGDLAETIALLLPPPAAASTEPLHIWVERLLDLRQQSEAEQREALVMAWTSLNDRQRFVWNKLITGAFRVGVSQQLVVRGLAAASGLDPQVLTHRLMGHWEPSEEFFVSVLLTDSGDSDFSRPYPFFLATPLVGCPDALGALDDWQVEWKWDGIRAQWIRRRGESFLWSRGEELMSGRFPEIEALAESLPDGTVLDAEVLPWRYGSPLPFAALQKRLGRKKITPRLLAETPVKLMAFDLLEYGGEDWRQRPLQERRAQLERLVATVALGDRLSVSPVVVASSWDGLAAMRAESRQRGVEGLMLKRRAAPYRVGRPRGDWWKWKIDPLTMDAVLIYAQRGSGKRASLYTDYTFAVWDGEQLVPVAKAYSGLTDVEIREVDAFVRGHTREKFGPVRSVAPELVFELAFEGIQRSSRHKSGVAVRFPRIVRRRFDKSAKEADTLDLLRRLLPPEQPDSRKAAEDRLVPRD